MTTFRQPFHGSYSITLDFGEAWPPLYTDESPHEGIDYGTPMGTEILASADGVVTLVGNLQVGYGKYIKLSHENGTFDTLYAHLDKIYVRYSQTVKQGDVIGLSGSSGNSTGPHLHFEVRKKGIKIDPKTVLISTIDSYPSNYTPNAKQREFEPVQRGFCKVVCDVANVRCHCDMSRVMGTLEKGELISVGEDVTMWNGLPYRDYYDPRVKCWLRIAEHDPETQIIVNCELNEKSPD